MNIAMQIISGHMRRKIHLNLEKGNSADKCAHAYNILINQKRRSQLLRQQLAGKVQINELYEAELQLKLVCIKLEYRGILTSRLIAKDRACETESMTTSLAHRGMV